jgi:crotonobetainyl-CoA:carnitine CoA-transferase CaiB-like acyl-CoA transferase
MEHPVLGKYEHLGEAAILSKTPARPRMSAPCLGEHTEYVCKQLLHMPDEEFVELVNEGVFGI